MRQGLTLHPRRAAALATCVKSLALNNLALRLHLNNPRLSFFAGGAKKLSEPHERLNRHMAIYHCHISNVSRAKGSNACATYSYISGERCTCERTDDQFNYGREQRVVDVETYLPKNAPEEWRDGAKLFNAIENYETKSNARPAKKIEVALPKELDLAKQKEITKNYCKQINKMGYACTCAIHHDKKGKNPHAHILIANRPINSKGEFVQAKSRKEYVLDENGERVPQIDKKTGKQKLGKRNEKMWKRKTVKRNPLDERDTLKQLRKSWATECNKYLEQSQQISHESFASRGIERCPTIHEGYAAREKEHNGEVSERCEHNREVKEMNRYLETLQRLIQQLQQRAEELARKIKSKVQHSREQKQEQEREPSRQKPQVQGFSQEQEIERRNEQIRQHRAEQEKQEQIKQEQAREDRKSVV